MDRTPLYQQHRLAGAKLIDFAGWEMPIHYSGVIDEYQTVRSSVGLFDVSHMGRITVSGTGACAFLERITTNAVSTLAIGQARYGMVCNDRGGIKDDVFVYRTEDDAFLLCVNASNRVKILDWLRQQHRNGAHSAIEDRTTETAQIAIQGPHSRAILARLSANEIGDLRLHRSCEGRVADIPCFIARTGYTGELGYELNVESSQATELWNRLLEAGRTQGIKPAGLGARDLLRLEMGYLLYGNDINEETTPLEAGAEWAVNFHKGDFIGVQALAAQKEAGITRQLVAFELSEKGVPRQGFAILAPATHQRLGEVTSGNFSPRLQKGIGLGYVSAVHAIPGNTILIDIRGKRIGATVVKPPFYKR
ncbi:MAG TPA: glycine cleavage system aminomethyltransferase GcvT [Nitrospira sp.]|nr:glycine cleavage system aminomethyltransferase GcvT [Nitrospira sp.]